MKIKKTQRGFSVIEFTDFNKMKCSLQKSSIATDHCIWFGADDLEISIGYPWRDVSEEEIKAKFNGQEIVGNNRMHLSRKQVSKLLPILQKFVETGEL